MRLDDTWWSDPRALALSADARDLFIRLVNYCASHDNDGVMTARDVALGSAGQPGAKRRAVLIDEIVAAEFLEGSTDDRLRVVEPFEYLLEAEVVEARRAREREKKKRQRLKGQGSVEHDPRDGQWRAASPRDKPDVPGGQADDVPRGQAPKQVGDNPLPVPSRPDLSAERDVRENERGDSLSSALDNSRPGSLARRRETDELLQADLEARRTVAESGAGR